MKTVTDYVKEPWCTCNHSGKCLGCEMERKIKDFVKEHWGQDGVNKLMAHFKEDYWPGTIMPKFHAPTKAGDA